MLQESLYKNMKCGLIVWTKSYHFVHYTVRVIN